MLFFGCLTELLDAPGFKAISLKECHGYFVSFAYCSLHVTSFLSFFSKHVEPKFLINSNTWQGEPLSSVSHPLRMSPESLIHHWYIFPRGGATFHLHTYALRQIMKGILGHSSDHAFGSLPCITVIQLTIHFKLQGNERVSFHADLDWGDLCRDEGSALAKPWDSQTESHQLFPALRCEDQADSKALQCGSATTDIWSKIWHPKAIVLSNVQGFASTRPIREDFAPKKGCACQTPWLYLIF